MSQAAQTQSQAQAPVPPQVPLLVQYKMQLESFKQQRDQVKIQFDQLVGAVFACEQMIIQYENNAKQAAMDLAKKVADDADSLKPNENLGAINDGKANSKSAKQASKK